MRAALSAVVLLLLAAPLAGQGRGRLTTHVLDTAAGKPAAQLEVTLERHTDSGWQRIGKGRTNDQGRLDDLYPAGRPLQTGTHRLIFATGDYFAARRQRTFYPRIELIFEIAAADEHYHVPLLLSPFGYTTYRGS